MENNIICHEFGVENEQQYAYCKNCGAALKTEPVNEAPNGNGGQYAQNTYNYNQDFMLEHIDGIPTEDVAVFVVKKYYEIIPKFSKMEITASKTGWCWPAALLGLFCGPLGAAIWFFYRKMYKIALIFVVIGIVMSASYTLISDARIDTEAFKSAGESFTNGDLQGFSDYLDESLSSVDTVRNRIADTCESIIDLATMIVSGVFGFYFYKKHCVSSIIRYRNMPVDPRYYKMGLASIGGTSSGMAILGVALLVLVEDLISMLLFLV